MNHRDHVSLLRRGIDGRGGVWADLGCGSGAFTLALADLLGSQAVLYAVDKDPRALKSLEVRVQGAFPNHDVRAVLADFTTSMKLPALDGIVMANSLHFMKEKGPLIREVAQMLRPTGRLIVVEYNIDQGNPWVPYPISFSSWQELARECGFREVRQIGSRPSSFLREIYSALNLRE